ncbi:MAG: YihY/virulence factor BrkB family protein [Pseudomonadota bacterium]
MRGIARFIGRIIKSFFKDDCFNYAANISFYALLAVIPIGLLMVSIAGYFLGASQEAFQRIVEVATDVLPVGRDVFVANLQSILDQRASLGIYGILFLVFISTILVASVERALDVVFSTPTRRNFFHSRMLGIALIFWITLLFSMPTMVGVLEGLLMRYGFDFPLSDLMTGKFYFFLVAFLSYLMLVVVVPNRKVFIRYALIGGVLFSVSIGVAKFLFSSYMSFSMQRYNIIYGSFTAAVLFVVWIYYLSVLMLLTAEIVAALQERRLLHRNTGAVSSQ